MYLNLLYQNHTKTRKKNINQVEIMKQILALSEYFNKNLPINKIKKRYLNKYLKKSKTHMKTRFIFKLYL